MGLAGGAFVCGGAVADERCVAELDACAETCAVARLRTARPHVARVASEARSTLANARRVRDFLAIAASGDVTRLRDARVVVLA